MSFFDKCVTDYIKKSEAMKICEEYSSHCFENSDARGQDIADRILDDIVDMPVANISDKWISVNDGLPEIEKEEKHGDHRIKKSVRVLCACKQKSGKVLVKEGYYHIWDWSDEPYWRIPGNIDSVTHWMPLPEPPKEKDE